MEMGEERNGVYSSRSSHHEFFIGVVDAPAYETTCNSCAPLGCHFFMWIVSQNRCRTSDRLARHGLAHQPMCTFCDPHDESIEHQMVGCVVWRHGEKRIGYLLQAPRSWNGSAQDLLLQGGERISTQYVFLVFGNYGSTRTMSSSTWLHPCRDSFFVVFIRGRPRQVFYIRWEKSVLGQVF